MNTKSITALLCTLALGFALTSPAPAKIVYSDGPPFQFPDESSSTPLDLDADGNADYSFSSGPFICTADVPTSGCTGPYFITALNANEVLCQGTKVVLVPEGMEICNTTGNQIGTPDGLVATIPIGTWKNTDGATIISYFFSPRFGTSGWGGPLSTNREGYLGVRFHARDGLHYGWIRAELQEGDPVGATPVIVDWAYETFPNTAIRAGEKSYPVTLAANFTGANEIPANRSTHTGTGNFTLWSYVDGCSLSYNLALDYSFRPGSAGIYGPASPFLISRDLVADLGAYHFVTNYPWVDYPYYYAPVLFTAPQTFPILSQINPFPIMWGPTFCLAYNGELSLTHKQAAELLAGRLYVNFPSARYPRGELRGAILPAADIRFSANLDGRNEIPRHRSSHHAGAAFTLNCNHLLWQVAVDTNLNWRSIGIYRSPFIWPNPFNQIAKLDATIGVYIPVGGLRGAPGNPGQLLYPGTLTLTDQQVSWLEDGQFYLNLPSRAFPDGELSGRIELVE